MKKTVIALVGTLIFITPISWAQKALSYDEIKRLFSGKTYLSERVNHGAVMQIYSAPNGDLIMSDIEGKKLNMKWSVKGNKHCYHHGSRRALCGKIISQGNGVYHKLMGSIPIARVISLNVLVYHNVKDGKHGLTFSNFKPGNRL